MLTAGETGTIRHRPHGQKRPAALAPTSRVRDLPEQVWAAVRDTLHLHIAMKRLKICLRRYKTMKHFHGINIANGTR